jgi:uncharacterized protein YbjQ (UPF0145 family)
MDGSEQQPREQDQAEHSLARIEAGHIPASAERRLRELGEGGGCFTSDLSINGFALCHRLGLIPLAQVMGSSIYQMGYQSAWAPGTLGSLGLGGSFMVELDTLSHALNEVRTRALARMAEEAASLGADAVVEVDTHTAEGELESGSASLEHTVFGTAVRRDGAHGKRPVLSELSVSEFSQLVRAGFEPLGIVAWSAVFFAGYAFGAGLAFGEMGGAPTQNYELREFTRAFYEAREIVMAQLGAQAAALGASGVVGVRVTHGARQRSLATGMGSRERNGLMVTFNAIGTAVHERSDASVPAPEPVLDLFA